MKDGLIFKSEVLAEIERNKYARFMTMRDYFAAKAMEMFLQKMSGCTGTNLYEHRVAKEAYTMADAMLKAREA